MSEPFIIKENQYLVIDAWTKENPKLIAGFSTKNGGVSQNEFQTLNVGFHVHDRLEDVQTNRAFWLIVYHFRLDVALERNKHMKLIFKRCSVQMAEKGQGNMKLALKGQMAFIRPIKISY